MIKLDISVAVFFYLLFSFVLMLLLWLFQGYRKRGVKFRADHEYIWRCEICAHTYLHSKDERVSKCPQCGSLNVKRELLENNKRVINKRGKK